jgi:hypothetical protein
MSGRPRVHAPGDSQFELGYYKLNLSKKQLDDISKKLQLEPKSDFRRTLESGQGVLEPSDAQELLITYKGRYVRIKYQQGRPVRITPED